MNIMCFVLFFCILSFCWKTMVSMAPGTFNELPLYMKQFVLSGQCALLVAPYVFFNSLNGAGPEHRAYN